jgi:hypothetical protein
MHSARRNPHETQVSSRDQLLLNATFSTDVQDFNRLIPISVERPCRRRPVRPIGDDFSRDGQSGIDVSPRSPTCDPDLHADGFLSLNARHRNGAF